MSSTALIKKNTLVIAQPTNYMRMSLTLIKTNVGKTNMTFQQQKSNKSEEFPSFHFNQFCLSEFQVYK